MLPLGRLTLKGAKPPAFREVLLTPGDHIRKRRLELRLFQREAGQRMSVSSFTVANWEKGRTEPTIRDWPQVIAFLGYDPHPVPKSLPDRLLAARRWQGISRRELAQRVGLDEETLARWERGTRQPRGKYLTLVERFLGDLQRGG